MTKRFFVIAAWLLLSPAALFATCVITTTSPLPTAHIGQAYGPVSLATSGCTPPVTWAATNLPLGINLNAGTGALSGTPGRAGSFIVHVTATDAALNTAPADLTLPVSNLVQVTASSIGSAGGVSGDPVGPLLVQGTIGFLPTDLGDNPIPSEGGGGGQFLPRTVTAKIANGAIVGELDVADTSQTTPVNLCFRMTISDSVTHQTLARYKCVQPAWSNSWCVNGVCNLDLYQYPQPGNQFITSDFSAGGDLAGSLTSQTVIGLRTKPLDSSVASPSDGWVIAYDSGLGKYKARAEAGGGFSAGGDLSGTSTSQTVIGLRGKQLDPNIATPSDGNVIAYNAATGHYEARTGVGTGTVTSVGAAVPGGLTVSGVPITSSGVITIGISAAADRVWGTIATNSSSWLALPDCPNDGAHALVYSISLHAFACAAIVGGGGGGNTTSTGMVNGNFPVATGPNSLGDSGVAQGAVALRDSDFDRANIFYQEAFLGGLGAVKQSIAGFAARIGEIGNSDTTGLSANHSPMWLAAAYGRIIYGNGGAGFVSFNTTNHPPPLGANAAFTHVGSAGAWSGLVGNTTSGVDCTAQSEPCGPDLTAAAVTNGFTGGPDTAFITCNQATDVWLIYGKKSGYGTFVWNIDGGTNSSPVSENNSGAKDFGLVKVTGLVEGAHTMNIAAASDPELVFLGGVCLDNARPGFSFDNLAVFSSTAANYLANPLEAAELTALNYQGIGINHAALEAANSISPTQYGLDMQNLINLASGTMTNGDVWLVFPQDEQPVCIVGGCPYPESAYEAVAQQLARTNSTATHVMGFFDFRKTWRSTTVDTLLPDGKGGTMSCMNETSNPIHIAGRCAMSVALQYLKFLTGGADSTNGVYLGLFGLTEEGPAGTGAAFAVPLKLGSDGKFDPCTTADATIASGCYPGGGPGMSINSIGRCTSARCTALFDNQTVVGDAVGISTTVNGEYHDLGSNTAPGGPIQLSGRVPLGGANTGAGTTGLLDTTGAQFIGGASGGSSGYGWNMTSQTTSPLNLACGDFSSTGPGKWFFNLGLGSITANLPATACACTGTLCPCVRMQNLSTAGSWTIHITGATLNGSAADLPLVKPNVEEICSDGTNFKGALLGGGGTTTAAYGPTDTTFTSSGTAGDITTITLVAGGSVTTGAYKLSGTVEETSAGTGCSAWGVIGLKLGFKDHPTGIPDSGNLNVMQVKNDTMTTTAFGNAAFATAPSLTTIWSILDKTIYAETGTAITLTINQQTATAGCTVQPSGNVTIKLVQQ